MASQLTSPARLPVATSILLSHPDNIPLASTCSCLTYGAWSASDAKERLMRHVCCIVDNGCPLVDAPNRTTTVPTQTLSQIVDRVHGGQVCFSDSFTDTGVFEMVGPARERHALRFLADDGRVHPQPHLRDCQLPLQCKPGDFVPVLVRCEIDTRLWWVGKVIRVDDKGVTLRFPCE